MKLDDKIWLATMLIGWPLLIAGWCIHGQLRPWLFGAALLMFVGGPIARFLIIIRVRNRRARKASR